MSKGERHVLSYLCAALRAQRVAAFKSLQGSLCSQALVPCVMRSRVIPDIDRSDRGAEMTSRVNQEFLALCGVKRIKGCAYTPRHQGPVGRSHQVH